VGKPWLDVVRVADEHDLVVAPPRVEAERACANRPQVRGVGVGVGPREQRRRQDGRLGHAALAEQRGVVEGKAEDDEVRLWRRDRGHSRGEAGARPSMQAEQQLREGPRYVFGGERSAVVSARVASKPKGDAETIARDLLGFGEFRHQLAVPVELHQPVGWRAGDGVDRLRRGDRRVEMARVAGPRDRRCLGGEGSRAVPALSAKRRTATTTATQRSTSEPSPLEGGAHASDCRHNLRLRAGTRKGDGRQGTVNKG